ncbi:MAG TPA: glycosyltransferase family 4 protein [Terriglobia bacterium]|nr:glycosyltransferase family 4 protein [Terriglobia bacterium]
MRKLRILTCAYACVLEEGSPVVGGEAVLGWNVIRQIGRFHQVWVLTSASNRPGIEAELQRQAQPNLTFVYIEMPRRLRPFLTFLGGIQFYAYLWQIQAYLAARKLHARVKFDAFHHVTYANDWMASYVGALLPVPYLRGPGGGAHRTPKAFLKEYSFTARLWERFRTLMQWVLRHDPIYLRGQRRARVILLCNREATDAVPPRLKSKVQLFPVNGISAEDLRIFSGTNGKGNSATAPDQDRKGLSNADFQVFSAGKLLGLKGYPLAIRAFGLFAQHHADVKFTIVGDGPERVRLEGLVRNLGLERQVRLEKWMPRPELLHLMRHADTFLFPSLRDGGGAVVVEAMAAGIPVICMDLAGPGMHVTEECGIKIPARSPDETTELMARALERLYRDRKLCAKMGQAGRARAEQVYSWDHLGERLLRIYEEVLGAPSQEA